MLVLFPLCFALCLPAAPAPQSATTVLRDVSLVDVEAGVVLPQRTLVIEGERIAAVLPAESAVLPEGARTIEGSGLYLFPGLIDAHVHFSAGGDGFGPLCVANGVTCVRDMGGATPLILATRDALNRGERLGPEMVATGAIVDGDPPVWPFSKSVRNAEEARAAVRELAEAGVDQIKVYSRLSPEAYRAVIEEAHARGLRAVGHVPDSVPLEEALALGQDEIAHLTGFENAIGRLVPTAELPAEGGPWKSFAYWFALPQADPAAMAELYRAVAEAGTAVCPTLVVMQGIARVPYPELRRAELQPYVPRHLLAFWSSASYEGFGRWTRRALPEMQKVVAGLRAAGVPILAGTDLANPWVIAGFSLHEELRLLQQAGLSPADCLRAATVWPADFLGLGERLGRVRAGLTASLVLTRANPLDDIANAEAIEGVCLRGRWLDRAALDELLAQNRVVESAPAEAASAAEAAAEPTPPGLEAPEVEGEPIARGAFVLRFAERFPAGREEFLIAHEGEGYRLWVKSTPAGMSPMQPFVLDFHYDADLRFQRGAWRQLVEPPIDAAFERVEGSLRVAARQGGAALGTQELDFDARADLAGSTFVADYFRLGRAALGIGERARLTSCGIGESGWRVECNTLELERLPDQVPSGRQGEHQVYVARFDSPEGELSMRYWLDQRGLVARIEMELPFGKLSGELE